MKILSICCMLVSLVTFPSFANDNVQNRNGIFYDIKTNQKFTGTYTSKYIHKVLSGSKKIEWISTYRYKIPVENGLRNGTATLYKSKLAQYIDDGREYQRIDSYKDIEANFSKGKILSVKQYSRDRVLRSITSFNKGIAQRYDQETGKLIGKFSYIESGEINPPDDRGDKGYYLFFGNSYAIDGELYVYKSKDRTRMKTYKNSVQHGPFVSMHSKDQVFQQGSYSHGEMDGDYKLFCEDGRLGRHVIYLAGEVVETIVDKGSNYCYE